MRRVLLTGGSGFIGKNIISSHSNDFQWLAPSSAELNLCDEEALLSCIRQHQITDIVHSAVFNSLKNPNGKECFSNLQMSMNIEKASHYVNKVIVFGSGAEYGKELPIQNVTEDQIGERIPKNEYGISKYMLNKIVRSSDNMYNLRLFGVFGPYENWEKCFISNICCKAMYDLELTIRQNCLFSYVAVKEVVLAVENLLKKENPDFRDYNLTYEQPITLLEIAQLVQKISGCRSSILIAKDGMNLEYTGNGDRYRKEFHQEIHSYEQEIKQLYDWYLGRKEKIDYSVIKNAR